MISVLIIDTSAVVRRELGALVSRQTDMRFLASVSSLESAVQRLRREQPDVIISGVRIRAGTFSCPIVSFGASGTVRVSRPDCNMVDWMERHGRRLMHAVRTSSVGRATRKRTVRLLAIGSSTGGPPAVELLLRGLGPAPPGILIAQHMAAGYTASFADRLNEVCPQQVSEARSGQPIEPGQVLVAPGDQHLCVVQRAGRLYAMTNARETVNGHRPSVDVLFRSVASVVGAAAVGVLLTGMGRDGAQGLLEMRRSGAMTIAQDEASSVVFGMPGAAVELGAVAHVLPLTRIAARLRSRAA